MINEENRPNPYPKPYKPNSLECWLVLLGGVLGAFFIRGNAPEQIGLNVVLLISAIIIAVVRFNKWTNSTNRELLGAEPYFMLIVNVLLLIVMLMLLVKSILAESQT